MPELNIPVGISEFEKIRKNGYYYIDKSELLEELLKEESTEATLITRPRRFGKTMGMSMLESFFDIRKDSGDLFAGLAISRNQKLCEKWMNQWPTVFISFKRVEGLNFQGAYDMLSVVISEVYKKHLYLLESDKINAYDKEILKKIVEGKAHAKDIKNSLIFLTHVLKQYYGRQVNLLIDEYDEPLAKANSHGYYNEMLDVMNYMRDIRKNPQAQPASYWKNTSDNAIIRSFIDYAGTNITKQLETLLAGGYIVKQIDENLTYDYLHSSEENLWSVLYLTGYLTQVREADLREPVIQ